MHRQRLRERAAMHSCGFEHEECQDPCREFFVEQRVCYADMQLAAREARYDDMYGGKFHDGTFKRWASERSERFPFGHRDGVTFNVVDHDTQPDALWVIAPTPVSRESGTTIYRVEAGDGP